MMIVPNPTPEQIEERRGINLMRDLGFDESDPEIVKARADAAFEEQVLGEFEESATVVAPPKVGKDEPSDRERLIADDDLSDEHLPNRAYKVGRRIAERGDFDGLDAATVFMRGAVYGVRKFAVLDPEKVAEVEREAAPTEAQVEAAAKALRADEGFMEDVHSALEVSWSEYIARLVLVAAQGAAPPVNSFDTTAERVKKGADSLHVAPQELCPQPCEHLSAEDAREGRDCREHPCTCPTALTSDREKLIEEARAVVPQAETPQCGPCRRGQHGCCDGNEYLRCECSHGAAPVLSSSGVIDPPLHPDEREPIALNPLLRGVDLALDRLIRRDCFSERTLRVIDELRDELTHQVLPSSGVDEERAEAVRETARYIDRIAPNGLVPKRMILADMELAADRLGRGIHANGNDREQGGESRGER